MKHHRTKLENDDMMGFKPIGSMYGKFTYYIYIWLIFTVNVSTNAVHGSCGKLIWDRAPHLSCERRPYWAISIVSVFTRKWPNWCSRCLFCWKSSGNWISLHKLHCIGILWLCNILRVWDVAIDLTSVWLCRPPSTPNRSLKYKRNSAFWLVSVPSLRNWWNVNKGWVI